MHVITRPEIICHNVDHEFNFEHLNNCSTNVISSFKLTLFGDKLYINLLFETFQILNNRLFSKSSVLNDDIGLKCVSFHFR